MNVTRTWRLMAAFALAVPLHGLAQEEAGGKPAPSNVRGKEYPMIHPDRRVTFRVTAPEAQKVAVAGHAADSGMNGNTPYDMKKRADGIWEVTTGPVRPGFHYYELIIDGHRSTDPASQTYFGWAQQTSGLEVPDPELDFYEAKDVPHGEVRVRWYRSKTTGQYRQAYMYTPPGTTATRSFAIRCSICSTAREKTQTSWTRQGKVNLIMDNLIAERKALPMLVVMEQGYAVKAGDTAPAQAGNAAFGELVINDLVPMIDSTYRTLDDRHSRAIAGLSMGAGQAMQIGLANLDRFASIGIVQRRQPQLRREDIVRRGVRRLEDGERKARPPLDRLWDRGPRLCGRTSLHQALDAAGVRHSWFEGPGSHEWQVWRKHLQDFAPTPVSRRRREEDAVNRECRDLSSRLTCGDNSLRMQQRAPLVAQTFRSAFGARAGLKACATYATEANSGLVTRTC